MKEMLNVCVREVVRLVHPDMSVLAVQGTLAWRRWLRCWCGC